MITSPMRIEPMPEKQVTLSPEEQGYLMGLIRESLDYYRTLAGNEKCSDNNRHWHEFLQTLWTKLAR